MVDREVLGLCERAFTGVFAVSRGNERTCVKLTVAVVGYFVYGVKRV